MSAHIVSANRAAVSAGGVIVAHPDTQHSVHAAAGLKRAGLLRFLFTAASLKRPAWAGPVVRSLSPRAYARLRQHRAHDELTSGEIRTFPIHLLAMRCGDAWWARSRRVFGRMAGALGVREGCGVLAFNTNATETFRILNREGLPAVLDQTIAHRRWSNREAAEEAERFPEWGERWSCSSEREEWEDEELARANLVLVGSEFCARTLVECGVAREKIAVVHYGADLERFRPAPPRSREQPVVRLLFVGQVSLRKGIPYLLQALKRLRGVAVRLTIAGAMRVRPEVLRPLEGMLSIPRVWLHEDMPGLYREHDLFVFPSLVEGSSLSTYEALATGLPVITTPNAGSIVRDGIEGFVVPPRNVDGLADAIESLATNSELLESMSRAARVRAEEYGGWMHYGERLARAVQPTLRK